MPKTMSNYKIKVSFSPYLFREFLENSREFSKFLGFFSISRNENFSRILQPYLDLFKVFYWVLAKFNFLPVSIKTWFGSMAKLGPGGVGEHIPVWCCLARAQSMTRLNWRCYASKFSYPFSLTWHSGQNDNKAFVLHFWEISICVMKFLEYSQCVWHEERTE